MTIRGTGSASDTRFRFRRTWQSSGRSSFIAASATGGVSDRAVLASHILPRDEQGLSDSKLIFSDRFEFFPQRDL